jgi:hypothetical protein
MLARRHLHVVILTMLVLGIGASCSGEPSPPPHFAAAFEALDRALSEEVLNRTGFASRFPKPTPRQVVSFLFAPAGSQALVADVSPLGEEVDPMQDVPLWPRGILLRHSDPSPVGARQMILKWNDERGVVIAEALDEGARMVFRKEWKVGTLHPTRPIDPLDRGIYQLF